MAAHVPAIDAAPVPSDLHGLCLASGVVPDDAAVPARSDRHGAHDFGAVCKLCQRLQASANYLPVLVAVLIAPSELVQTAWVEDTPAQPPRLARTNLNPRGPPLLV